MAKGIHMANTNGILRLGQMLALGGATMVWNAILNHVNEGEHGGYIGGGLRFPKRMEERFYAIRTTYLMANAERRRIIILRG
jgi:hypothetical protein